jgi:tol-pal system protein YbgF
LENRVIERLGNRQYWSGLAVAATLVTTVIVAPGPAVAADDTQFQPGMEVRLMEMENRFRTVTGQYEEAMYRLTQMNRTLENTLADMDYRLQQLEQGTAPPPRNSAAFAATLNTSAEPPAIPVTAGGPAEGGVIESPPAAATATAADPTEGGIIDAPAEASASEAVTPETHPEQYLEGDTPEEQFRAAFFLVRRDELDKAINAYRAFIVLYPEHPYRANAAYWLGRSHAAKENYAESARILVDAYDKHADSDKGAEILLHLGLSLEQLGQNDDACSAYAELDRRYSNMSSAVKEGMIDGQKKAGCL